MVEKKRDAVINLNSAQSFQAMFITIHAHLANMACPGTFGKTVRKLLRLNNLPDIIVPDDALSHEIFGALNGLTGDQMPTVKVMQDAQDIQDMEDSDDKDEVGIEIEGKVSDIMPRPKAKSVRQKLKMYTSERQTNIRDTTTSKFPNQN